LQTSLDTLVAGGANAGGIDAPWGERFSEFAFRSTVPYDVRPADVTVRISNEDGNIPGRTSVQFIFGTPTAATQAGEVFIDYRVDELNSRLLNRVGVRFSGGVPSQGVGAGGYAGLTQAVSTVNGADLAPGAPVSDTESLVLFNDGPGRGEDQNSQFLSLNATYALRLSTRLTLNATEDGQLDVNFVDQFSTLPEPAAAAVALPLALALLARRPRPSAGPAAVA
jgi:hypothetical protein